MKPVDFRYLRPLTAADAIGALADASGEATIIAGGQRLGPMLNMRLVAPALLVDVNAIPELRTLDETEHETPSPFTTMGQKGVGEGGYMSTPAAVVCAINDALAPFGTRVDHVPVTPVDLLERLQ